MSSLVVFPSTTNAFSSYRPSVRAHVDFIKPGSGSQHSTGRIVKLELPSLVQPQAKDQLEPLFESIDTILAGQPTPLSYQHITAFCQTVVLQDRDAASRLSDKCTSSIDQYTERIRRELKGGILAKDRNTLGKLCESWQVWTARTNLLSSLLVHLDKVYHSSFSDPNILRSRAIAKFKSIVWQDTVIHAVIIDDIFKWLSEERQTGTPSRARPTILAVDKIAQTLETFGELAVAYQDETHEYYTSALRNAVSEIEQGNRKAGEYASWFLAKMVEEEDRIRECFHTFTLQLLSRDLRKVGQSETTDKVIELAVKEAMGNDEAKGFSELYQFSIEIDKFASLVKSLENYLSNRVSTLISDPANDPRMIDEILKLRRFAEKTVSNLFSEEDTEPLPVDEDVKMISVEEKEEREKEKEAAMEKRHSVRMRMFELEEAVRTGFKTGMGSRQNAPAEWIAKHLDAAMRKGQGSGTEEQFNNHLDEIVTLVGFTKDKDVFKAFYSSQLAKRLLLNKSASNDQEKIMVAKLQKELGEEFTSGDVMMKDLQLSETLVRSYQLAQSRDPAQYGETSNFTANVLTESAWPAYPLLKDGWNFHLTPTLQSSIDAFTSWYTTQHKNRVLSWRYQLATVTLTARFPSGRYEVGVSLFQAVVLLLYNEVESLTFVEIKERTGIEKNELVRTLQSLALGRKGTRVLLKKPSGKEVNPTDIFAWNKGFASERIKFKINQIQQDMSAEESRKTNEQVALDRVSILEATIVRIMKARKKLTLQLLIDGVVSDVSKRFPPDVKEIKKRVESLIEREFMARDEEDRSILHYVA
ncbi:ubiquitin-protein ligase [Cryptococcus neoformans Bt63]|nr:ubiquitin-protein ligase [Cryptococcus neoformans var. grubii Bt63]